jgi:hypothetical protein
VRRDRVSEWSLDLWERMQNIGSNEEAWAVLEDARRRAVAAERRRLAALVRRLREAAAHYRELYEGRVRLLAERRLEGEPDA